MFLKEEELEVVWPICACASAPCPSSINLKKEEGKNGRRNRVGRDRLTLLKGRQCIILIDIRLRPTERDADGDEECNRGGKLQVVFLYREVIELLRESTRKEKKIRRKRKGRKKHLPNQTYKQ